MPHLAASSERRSISAFLSTADIARIAIQAEELDAVFGEAVDLLPLDAFVARSERRRAA